MPTTKIRLTITETDELARAESGSSVPRRQLGRYLKDARESAGISLEAAAKLLEWSKAKMYRIEGGQASLRTHDVLAMCRVYGVPDDLAEALVSLAAETKSKGWWHAYGDAIPEWFELYVGLEAAAVRLRQYEPGLIPGLFQTRAYARLIMGTKPGITEAEAERKVALRVERQKLLTRRIPKAPLLDVILDEAVLRRPLPDVQAMRAQLVRLSDASRLPNIGIRIVPSVVGPHRGLVAGGFIILSFPSKGVQPTEPTTVYSESLTGALYLDKDNEVSAYETAWEALGQVALDNQASAALLHTIVSDMTGEN
jgi:transcriptional regulator with XRE-family HTH domain